VPVQDIDLKAMTDLDMLQLWLQVDNETKHNPQGFRLTKEEQAALAERNTDHEKPLAAQTEVMDIFAKKNTILRDVTVSEFKEAHSELRNYSADQISRALTKLGYEQRKVNVTVNGRRTTARVRSLPMWRQFGNPTVRATDDNPFVNEYS
jgi:hypothetical protein